jgi:hypothetical protein
VLCTRTNQFIVRVRFQMADGRSAEQSLFCGVGGQFSALCTENPEINISSPTLSGYRDVPAGSTPVPSGWHPGTVTVAAVMTFEITRFEPGAFLELRKIVVE